MNSTIFFGHRHTVAVIAAATLALSACGVDKLIGPPEAPQIYVLRPATGDLQGPRVSWALAVDNPNAANDFDTDRIAISRSANTRDYYANAVWPDKLPSVIQNLLVQAFEKSGRIDQVASDAAGLHTDYTLQTDIRTFEAHYAQPDGVPTAVVVIAASLISRDSHSIVARTLVEQQAPATQNSIDAAVDAFDRAFGNATTQLVNWTLASVPPSEGHQEQTRRHKRSR
jgi:cholesterol transport system auxiliary component